MVLMTEEQTLTYAEKVINFLRCDQDTKDLELGYWVQILGTSMFYLGVLKSEEYKEKSNG